MPDTRTTPISGIDSHAHVFSRELSLTAARRYTPNYDATLAQYQSQLQAHGLSHGVLVQPSFLGTDNRYLLDALKQAPQQLRGVVVLDPATDLAHMRDLAGQGVVGARLNLMGCALPDFGEPVWKAFLDNSAALGWHIELHRQVADIPGLLQQLKPFGVNVVIDHFGRPDARLGLDQPGFRQMLELGQGGQVWMKVSGIYRLAGTASQNLDFAREALLLLQQSLGPERLVWGSDWPHTQFEERVGYATVIQQLDALGCSAAVRQALLVQAPRELFRFV